MWDKILSVFGIGKLIEKAGDRAIDKFMGESPEQAMQHEKIENEHEIAEAQVTTERYKALWDFIAKYEGLANEVPKGILWVRSSLRPLITFYSIFMVYLSVYLDKPIEWNSIPGLTTLAIVGTFVGENLIIAWGKVKK